MTMRRVLVTGGAGFIGSHTAAAFLGAGWQAVVLDDLSSGRREHVAAGVQLVRGDVRDVADVRAAIEGCEVVVHLAAFTSVPESFERHAHCFDVNVQGTLTVLEAARQAGVQRVVLASSSAIYPDDAAAALDEDVPPQPGSPYGISKLEGEHLVEGFGRRGLGWIALRYFNVYGPRQPADSAYAGVVPIFVERALTKRPMPIHGTGEQTRDFVSVVDVARANYLAATAGVTGVFNVGSGRRTSVLELADAVEAAAGHHVGREFLPARSGDAMSSLASTGRIMRDLGWRAGVTLDEGLRGTLAWRRGRVMTEV